MTACTATDTPLAYRPQVKRISPSCFQQETARQSPCDSPTSGGLRLDLPAAERPQDWAAWMEREIEDSDFVLVVASPAYKKRTIDINTATVNEGRGVRWETRLIRELSYADSEAGLQK